MTTRDRNSVIDVPATLITDDMTVGQLHALMQSELKSYYGRTMDERLKIELDILLERWRHRIDPLVPGIRFSASFDDGHLKIGNHIEAPPQYVLVIRTR